MDLRQFGLSFIALFVALDIFGTLPIYASISQGLSREKRKTIVNFSMWVAFLVALVFLFLGETIFRYLGITLSDFRIAGGLVLLLVSLSDLVGKPEVENRGSGSTGVVPLAVPLITGPAVLTTLLLQSASSGYFITVVALIVNYFLAWIVLRNVGSITKAMGKDGTVILSKIAALLLAAIAVAMIRSGIVEAFRAAHG
jgi:multiple antibiotic resistance protein